MDQPLLFQVIGKASRPSSLNLIGNQSRIMITQDAKPEMETVLEKSIDPLLPTHCVNSKKEKKVCVCVCVCVGCNFTHLLQKSQLHLWYDALSREFVRKCNI